MSEQREGLTALELDQLHKNCTEIADLADGLKEILTELVENTSNTKALAVINISLSRIITLAEEYI